MGIVEVDGVRPGVARQGGMAVRLALLSAALTGVLGAVMMWLVAVLVRLRDDLTSPVPVSLPEAVTLGAAAAALSVAAWLGLTTVVALLSHLPGRPGRRAARAGRFLPALSHRGAALLAGVILCGTPAPALATPAGTASPVSTATAAPVPAWAPQTATTATTATGSSPAQPPGWVPSRPLTRPLPSPELLSGRPVQADRTVVVRRGDTLWHIARRHLGPEATPAQVCAEWPRWHRANREVIGDDPHRLLPGQVLTVPGGHR